MTEDRIKNAMDTLSIGPNSCHRTGAPWRKSEETKPSTVTVRVNSHRAGQNLKRLLGVDSLDWFWNMHDGNNFAEIPAERLAEAREIKGITKARPTHPLWRCWSMV